MASCYICHKKNEMGWQRSHSNIKTKRLFKANLHVMRVMVDSKELRRALCSKCLKKIQNDFWGNKNPAVVPLSLLNQKKYKSVAKAV
ncbi:MAG: 50S ribosomal protein L28 [Patescibacteria group bacterium]